MKIGKGKCHNIRQNILYLCTYKLNTIIQIENIQQLSRAWGWRLLLLGLQCVLCWLKLAIHHTRTTESQLGRASGGKTAQRASWVASPVANAQACLARAVPFVDGRPGEPTTHRLGAGETVELWLQLRVGSKVCLRRRI